MGGNKQLGFYEVRLAAVAEDRSAGTSRCGTPHADRAYAKYGYPHRALLVTLSNTFHLIPHIVHISGDSDLSYSSWINSPWPRWKTEQGCVCDEDQKLSKIATSQLEF